MKKEKEEEKEEEEEGKRRKKVYIDATLRRSELWWICNVSILLSLMHVSQICHL